MFGRAAVIGTGIIAAAALAIGLSGWLLPVDTLLRDVRADLAHRPATGSVVFLDIDSAALTEVGVWPWPRAIHAKAIDALMELGAANVVLDIDFSVASNPTDDALLAAALQRAGGYVMLAAFRQLPTAGSAAFNLPLPEFHKYAEAVLVNVGIDQGGTVRNYPFGAWLGDTAYASVASVLSEQAGAPDSDFIIDYSITASGIPRISAGDLLGGTVDPQAIDGKQVIMGASALELRDIFVVPVSGAIAGGLVQAIATETLLQNRVLRPLGPLLPLAFVALLVALSLFTGGRKPLHVALGSAIVIACGLEIVAALLQIQAGLLLDTAIVHLVLVALALWAVAREMGLTRLLHRKASHELLATRSILDRVIADNFDGVVVITEDGNIIAASRLAEDLLGAGLVGRTAANALPRALERAVQRVLAESGASSPAATAETLLATPGAQGRIVEYSVTLSEVHEPGKFGEQRSQRVACLTFRDVTERRHNDQRLTYLASHDPLTGAWSRLKLVEMINALVEDDTTRAAGVTVILIDLGRFKAVNDTLGHSYGDMVLKQVSARLRACDVEAVARLGGDSFALARAGALRDDELAQLCQTVLARITEPYVLEQGHHAIIAASAGVTTTEASGYEPELLLSQADMALSAAKLMPGSKHAVFVTKMNERLKEKQDMELALRVAIERNELTLAYQSQVDLETGEVLGVEALVRWDSPELGAISPAVFIPAAEESGQIVEVGRFVLRTACKDAMTWPGKLRLAVNVSPIQFELVDVVAEVEAALDASGLPPERLEIEITEGLFVSNGGQVTAMLERLRAMGITIALDDFGTGYSSLSYLGRLPVDRIKIDQSFVRNLPADQESGAIVRAVMTLSDTLGKVVVAEGIENADQAWMLRILGCQIGQGYHFGRPKSATEMAAMFVSDTSDQAFAK